MNNTIKYIETKMNNVNLELHSHFLKHSASFRKQTIDVLENIKSEEGEKIICIDWSEFTSNIAILNDNEVQVSNILLNAWIDWIITNWKAKVKLILPVADCAAIASIHKSWEINWIFHAWYKWVAWNNDYWIIVNMLKKLRNVSNSENLDDFNFYISPMMWWKFELPIEYVNNLFSQIIEEYNLSSSKYFTKHKDDNTKIYLNLKQIIKDIFQKEWIKLSKQTHFDRKKTNTIYNNLPSYRLYSQEKWLLIDYRLALILKNF